MERLYARPVTEQNSFGVPLLLGETGCVCVQRRASASVCAASREYLECTGMVLAPAVHMPAQFRHTRQRR